MSVLIKGAEMPESCDRCEFCKWSNLHQTGRCLKAHKPCFEDFSIEYRSKRAEFCPLVELPPHGRLIDADALMENAQYKGTHDIVTAWDIVAAPTVIEAESEDV